MVQDPPPNGTTYCRRTSSHIIIRVPEFASARHTLNKQISFESDHLVLKKDIMAVDMLTTNIMIVMG